VKTRMLTVVADADALAETAAERIVARVTQRTGPLAMCFTGGSTPERLYALLGAESYRKAVPWDRIHWFWGDDRFVPHDDPRSNFGAARRLLLDRVPVPSCFREQTCPPHAPMRKGSSFG